MPVKKFKAVCAQCKRLKHMAVRKHGGLCHGCYRLRFARRGPCRKCTKIRMLVAGGCCNACDCKVRRQAAKNHPKLSAKEVGRGLDIDMPLRPTGMFIDNVNHELIAANGARQPAPPGLALTHYFGSPDRNGLMPVYRADPPAKRKSPR